MASAKSSRLMQPEQAAKLADLRKRFRAARKLAPLVVNALRCDDVAFEIKVKTAEGERLEILRVSEWASEISKLLEELAADVDPAEEMAKRVREQMT